jgi:cytochrome c biogenesis protein CcmG/thiol:disulfide interchange protein DsbE
MWKRKVEDMKTRYVVFLVTIFLFYMISVSCGESNPSLSRLPSAPNFVLKDLNGKKVTLTDFKGKVIILTFWATWCPPCRAEIPHFVDLYSAYRSKGLEVVGISLDSYNVGGLKDFVKKYQITYPVLVGDNKISSDYGGITSIPTTFIITQDAKIFRVYVGYLEKSDFEKDIKILLRK